MSEKDGRQEPSMEEILASIRKVISEDEEERPKEVNTRMQSMEFAMEQTNTEIEPEPGPEIDGVLKKAKEEDVSEDSKVEDTFEHSEGIEEGDELELTEEYLEEEGVETQENLGNKTSAIKPILSDPTQQAGVDAFGQLTGMISGRMQLGQGRTVEDLVQELIQPLLREWLDKNLPELVEEWVQQEMLRPLLRGWLDKNLPELVEESVKQEMLRPALREWLDTNLPELVEELVKSEIERMVRKANR